MLLAVVGADALVHTARRQAALSAAGRARASAAMILLALPLLLLALFPPLAFDETLYHLPIVRALATSGKLQFLADLRFPAFPQLHELLCVPLFTIGGDVATHLVSLIEVAIAAVLLYEWGGILAAAFFLGSPIVLHLATITYVEAALMLFVTAGFYCLERGNYALSGFFFGTACSVKYLGGYFAIAALIIVLLRSRKSALTFAAFCAAAALPTTLWLIATTGNPVFPFFGSSLWAMSLPHATWRTLLVPWDVTFARAHVNFEPPFTPLLIAMIALVRTRWVALVCAGYLIAFAFLPQDSRYLVPLLPLLSIAAAATSAKHARWLAWIAIAPGVFYLLYRFAVDGLPPMTVAAREAFLTKRIPEYAALRRADGRVYVCGGEQLKYYARGELLGDFVGPYSYDRVQDPSRIHAQYFLVAKRACPQPPSTEGMDLIYEDAGAQLWRVHGSQSAP